MIYSIGGGHDHIIGKIPRLLEEHPVRLYDIPIRAVKIKMVDITEHALFYVMEMQQCIF